MFVRRSFFPINIFKRGQASPPIFLYIDMATRVALIGIIVESYESAEKLNEILHRYGKYIIGRMGIPYREKGIHVISVAVDAPQDVISSVSGQIGKLDGVSVKTVYSHVISQGDDE